MHNSYSGVSKVDMSEDIEPVLSKIDVVLTFAIEVCIQTHRCMRRLQSVQNATARLITGTRRSDHISPV